MFTACCLRHSKHCALSNAPIVAVRHGVFFGVSWDHAVDEASWNCRCQVVPAVFLVYCFCCLLISRPTICLDFKLGYHFCIIRLNSFLLDLFVIRKNGTLVLHGYRVQRSKGALYIAVFDRTWCDHFNRRIHAVVPQLPWPFRKSQLSICFT